VQHVSAGEIEIKAPKYGSERVVNLPDELVAMLARHIDAHTDSRAVAPWRFQGEAGCPPHHNTVGYWWRLTQKHAGCSARSVTRPPRPPCGPMRTCGPRPKIALATQPQN
jgi:hypothetical protein